VAVVLPVKRRLPIISCRDGETRDSHAYYGRVVEAPLLSRLPGNCVHVLGHFDASGNGCRETRFLTQFSLRSLRRRLAQLHAASYDVPVAAVRWRPVDEKNFATVATCYEDGDLRACAHRRSVGNHTVLGFVTRCCLAPGSAYGSGLSFGLTRTGSGHRLDVGAVRRCAAGAA